MTTRRKFLLTLGAGAFASPRVSCAQASGKVVRIGFLGAASATAYASRVEALRSGLREFGYVEGRNLAIEFRWAQENYDRLPELAGELVRLNVDVIVTHATAPTSAAKQATTTIPIVIASGGDPVASGFAASLGRPGGNITGSTNLIRELSTKRLEVLKEAFPRISRVAVLLNPGSSQAIAPWRHDMKIASKSLKVELQESAVRGPGDLSGAFSEMRKKRVDAVIVNEDPMLIANAKPIADMISTLRIPSIGFREIAQAGGLMAYGVNTLEQWRRAAYFVDRILKGAKPADLPIEQATKFELVINLKTAKALGLTIPQPFLMRADWVIE